MTVVAKFSVHDQPTIIADLLVSGPELLEKVLWLPSGKVVSEVFPKGSGFVPIKLKQKLCILSDSAVVGWSGPAIIARYIIENLKSQVKNGVDISEALSQLVDGLDKAKSEISLIGVSRENDIFRSFSYNYEHMFHKDLGTIETIGSGSADLQKAISRTPPSYLRSGDCPTLEASRRVALNIAGSLMKEEAVTGSNLLQFFGGGYEIVTFQNQSFRKLDDVLYVFWIYEEDGRFLRHPIRLTKQCYQRDLLFFRSACLSEKDTTLCCNSEIGVIAPVDRDLVSSEAKSWTIPEFNSEWICHLVLCRDKTKHSKGQRQPLKIFTIIGREPISQSSQYFSVREKKDGLIVDINNNLITLIAKAVTGILNVPTIKMGD